MPSTTPNSKTTVEESMFGQNAESESCVSAIVPARNEEAVIATCVKGLAQQAEIAEIAGGERSIYGWDGRGGASADGENAYVAALLKPVTSPAGWTGKNNAVWRGAAEAAHRWLLFTDADAELLPGATARALTNRARNRTRLWCRFRRSRLRRRWYEKSLMPFVYCRLARHFSFKDVNDPQKRAAAANGQFMMIRRDAYDAIGGHAAIAGEVLEDVALARNAKGAGYRIWFGAGKGIGARTDVPVVCGDVGRLEKESVSAGGRIAGSDKPGVVLGGSMDPVLADSSRVMDAVGAYGGIVSFAGTAGRLWAGSAQ